LGHADIGIDEMNLEEVRKILNEIKITRNRRSSIVDWSSRRLVEEKVLLPPHENSKAKNAI